MAMKLVCCLLAVGLFGCLASAQWGDPKFPQVPQYRPPNPQNPQKPPTSSRPQKPHPPPPPPPPPQNPQKPSTPPKKPSNPYPQNPQTPQNPPKNPPPAVPQVTETFHTCEVPENYKIQCGPPGISATDCGALSCCFDGRTCYYGKYVTLQCTKDAQFIVVVARDATLPNIDLESLSFLGTGPECGPVGTSSAFAIYQFPVTACGTVQSEEPGVIVYENRLTSSYGVLSGPNGFITRDTYFDLSVQCRYIGTSVEALVIEILPVPAPQPVAVAGPLNVELRLGSGQCNLKGCVEADVAYTSFYGLNDYPIRKVLRDPVYVDVYLADRTDPNLVLTLGRCWATADSNPYSLPQWDLLVNGCPYVDDRYQTTLIPVGAGSGLEFPSHYRRFEFKMFTFVSVGPGTNTGKKATQANPDGAVPLNENIYIHCETSVCQRTPANNCEPRCFRKRREIGASLKKTLRQETAVASSGLIVISEQTE
ncbi:zona pellucida sperm-binding protein 4-like [Salarias fasciatus]|uniref:Zona pellucida sperm-binding protein 4 n=1 Tax=Salarias fasciatus TaxID=181472 RepID=A0A672GH91_SALFA|nr:zona pellucida sperm-binding protein 4-like [Salarias fasciatus]